MGTLLRPFPLIEVARAKWSANLINWMQSVHRAVSGDYNVIHLKKDTGTTENIGGAVGSTKQILWDIESVKHDGFVHSTTSNTSKVEVESSGRYSIFANIVGVNSTASDAQIKAYIKKNGSEYFYTHTAYDVAIGTAWRISLQIRSEIELSAGDYIEVETYTVSSSGQAVTTSDTECEFIIRRIG